jgi:hypothetical protein
MSNKIESTNIKKISTSVKKNKSKIKSKPNTKLNTKPNAKPAAKQKPNTKSDTQKKLYNNPIYSSKLDEKFIIKLNEFKNKLITNNPLIKFNLSYGNTTVQIYYKIGEKKHIVCYVNKLNGDIIKLPNSNTISNINDTNNFNFKKI